LGGYRLEFLRLFDDEKLTAKVTPAEKVEIIESKTMRGLAV